MKRHKILLFVNIVLFLAFVITLSSVVLYKIIPSSLNGNEFIGEIHEIGGLVFTIFILLHIGFNWKWIKTQIFTRKVQ